jgi:2-oxoglutarate ferredoxin oxidoreductase subunit delta
MAKEKLNAHRVNRDWCKGCGICVAFCPKTVLELDAKDKVVAARLEDCIACRLCELRCPDLAIEVVVEEPTKDEGRGAREEGRGRKDEER